MLLSEKDIDRFWSKVARGDGCWKYLGKIRPDGYGRFKVKRDYRMAHRVAWTIVNGDIPDGLNVCHHCDVRDCVRPDHLFVGTQADNIHDMWAKGRAIADISKALASPKHNGKKTHCPRGHEYTEDNTYTWAGAPGASRQCRACTRKYAMTEVPF